MTTNLNAMADLVRVASGDADRRIDRLRDETHAQIMDIRHDLTEVRSALSLAFSVAALEERLEALEAEVAALRRTA
jgi:hypothetical protein